MVDAKILVVDDNKSVLSALEILLQFEYKSVQTIFNPNQISSFPNLEDIDIVLLDMNFSAGVNTGNEGLYWLNEIKKRSPNTSVIMMTAYGAVDLAVRALKQGASDFVLKRSRAINSFPVPFSPVMSTLTSVLATLATRFKTEVSALD